MLPLYDPVTVLLVMIVKKLANSLHALAFFVEYLGKDGKMPIILWEQTIESSSTLFVFCMNFVFLLAFIRYDK